MDSDSDQQDAGCLELLPTSFRHSDDPCLSLAASRARRAFDVDVDQLAECGPLGAANRHAAAPVPSRPAEGTGAGPAPYAPPRSLNPSRQAIRVQPVRLATRCATMRRSVQTAVRRRWCGGREDWSAILAAPSERCRPAAMV